MNASDLTKDRLARGKVISLVHGWKLRELIADALARDTLPHCDCTRCMMPRRFRDQYDAKGSRK